ncbi:esterase-like activity of phytase family protein [Streptomyces lunaelactis]|uniref:esterase-like activity of phytase family protein n=1 Tax=Streptomyces lunaelactis TaxID=1535768 RepID=UPI0015845742|nr:esterase-like activity of phytase family protein [Streptomyces lunaelactis]NUK73315.1 esterase-like activity of phytase family protein [Streptomyces lunaelactis]NUK81682.1 esterase-like activity of phytase family protein [Streptomyces lunaelactis]
MRLRTVLASVTAGLAVATCVAATGPANSQPRTNSCSSSVVIDGYSDALDKSEFQGTFVGNFSALALDGRGRIAALSDRSELFTLDARTYAPRTVVHLADEEGAQLDSEGLVVERDGSRLISSETEPSVRRYGQDGTLLGSLPVPQALRVAPAGRAGRNQTFEGLTLQPGGRTLVAAMEGPLAGDDAGIRRLQTWWRSGPQRDFRPSAQYGYRTDTGLSISESTATGDGRLLVLERGFTAGVGNTVRLYLADLSDASDVSSVEYLKEQDGVRLVRRTLLADLVDCPSLDAPAKQPQPNPLLDNIEALAVTGHAPGGRLRLLLASDDNQNAAQITRFYRLTVRLPRH